MTTTNSKPVTTTAHALSQYFTQPEIAADCIAQVDALYAGTTFETVIEPSAGQGAFSDHFGRDCIALDLDPKAPHIQRADFLTWAPANPTGRCLVIGNPPFANGGALNFLNHAASFADVVAFILPATFLKKSQQNRIAANMHLVHQTDIPTRAFTYNGKRFDVPCVFQIWERRDTLRAPHTLSTRHAHFVRCTQAEADIVIRRVGAHAGALKPLDTPWSAQSNIFLRAVGCSPEKLRNRFEAINLAQTAGHGAGGGSINMAEIVDLYEAALAKERAATVANTNVIADRQSGECAPLPANVIPFPLQTNQPPRDTAKRQQNRKSPRRNIDVVRTGDACPVPTWRDATNTSQHCSPTAAALTSLLDDLKYADRDTMTPVDVFLEDAGFDAQGLAELVRDDPIQEVWDHFGSFQTVKASARPGEHGVYEISDADDDHALSFLLPFDKTGALSGPGRITLETRHNVIEAIELDMTTSFDIWTEVAEEIAEALPGLSGETYTANDCCLPDHRYWVEMWGGNSPCQ